MVKTQKKYTLVLAVESKDCKDLEKARFIRCCRMRKPKRRVSSG